MISADTMRSLPDCFADIDDPRRRQGRRHPLPTVLAIADGASGSRQGTQQPPGVGLSPRARERFPGRHRNRCYEVPSEFVIRDVLVCVGPGQLDRALQRFQVDGGGADGAIAIDGKTMRSAIHTDDAEAEAEARAGNGDGTRAADDAEPAAGKIGGNQYQVHILGAVGQRSGVTHTQKKSAASRSAPTTRPSARRPQAVGSKSAPSSPCSRTCGSTSAAAPSPPTPCSPSASSPTSSAPAAPTSCSPPRATSPPSSTTSGCSSRTAASPTSASPPPFEHGRIESRAIWTTARLNGYLTFPHVGQAFLVERTATAKKSGKTSVEYALGITSHAPDSADARRLLELNRGHWKVESVHNILDNAFDEDRLRIRTDHGPENTTPPAPLRHRRRPRPRPPLRRRCHAPPRPQSPPRLRLPPHVGKHLQAPKTCASRRENKLAVGLYPAVQ